MAVAVSWNATFRNRVRLLAGIEQEELDNATMDILANIAVEWFQEQQILGYSCFLTPIYAVWVA